MAVCWQVGVRVQPVFEEPSHETEAKGNTEKDQSAKLAYETRVGLVRCVLVQLCFLYSLPPSLCLSIGSP